MCVFPYFLKQLLLSIFNRDLIDDCIQLKTLSVIAHSTRCFFRSGFISAVGDDKACQSSAARMKHTSQNSKHCPHLRSK